MKSSLRVVEMALVATVAVSPIGGVGSAWADGPNTAPHAPPPATPTPVITHTTAHTTVGQGGCQENYTAELNRLSTESVHNQQTGATAAVVGLTADLAMLGAEKVQSAEEKLAWGAVSAAAMPGNFLPGTGEILGTALDTFLAVDIPTEIAGFATAIAAKTAAIEGANSAVTGADLAADLNTKSIYVATLPNCDNEFTGTVTVDAGGVNVTGASLFNDDVGVTKNVNVEENVNANQVHASQGISADNGNIWLGDPNGTTYSDGITIGGGAVSGAGSGQPLAVTGHVDAIAIGNNARAMTSGSVTLGLNSTANGLEDVVVGATNVTGAGGNNTVVGNEIDIIGATSADNTVLGVGHQVTGSANFVAGDPNVVVGNNNVATGFDITVTGDDNVAIGNTVAITGNRAIAVGTNATATADNTTVIGNGAQANSPGSAAFGNGAIAEGDNRQVFGTPVNTYTAPGIATTASKARQHGKLEVVTSDTYGNMATDGGKVFESLSENQAGIAMAMAMVNPSLRGDQSFGIAANWGIFEQSQALAFSALGVVAEDLLGVGETIAVTGGFGLSVKTHQFKGQQASTSFGGRAGLQVAW